MRFLASGKVKDIYELDDSSLLFRFSDRVSAYDVKFKEEIPKKGRVLCAFAQYWFENIPVDNHFVKKKSDTEIVVKKMDMVPMECVVRGYLYGSLADRCSRGLADLPDGASGQLASRLPRPVFDPTTKSEHDVPVDRQKALGMNLVTAREFDWLESKSIEIYEAMTRIADGAGFVLADLKLEFGRLGGRLVLGDSIGPDEHRLWLKDDYRAGQIQQAYDKQILRDWLAAQGYQKQFDEVRGEGRQPVAPPIPDAIIQKMTQRYTVACQRITSRAL